MRLVDNSQPYDRPDSGLGQPIRIIELPRSSGKGIIISREQQPTQRRCDASHKPGPIYVEALQRVVWLCNLGSYLAQVTRTVGFWSKVVSR